MTATVLRGNARELPLADATVDAIVCDPPYELGFMGRAWDATGVAYDVATWREALRVLKPGGHLLAFGGSRTWHRLACAIEDTGFELRDSIAWLYGSGFPKSLDVSKAIDKQRDDRADVMRVTTWLAGVAEAAGVTRGHVDEYMGTSDMGGWWLSRLQHRCAVPVWDQWQRLRELLGFGTEMDAEVWRLNGRKGAPGEAWDQREVIGARTTGIGTGRGSVAYIGDSDNRDVTAPATDDARRWQGWGTALKPGFEPIVVARKPLAGTVAANVLVHGCGALNIDACRTAGAVPQVIQGGRRSVGGIMNATGEERGTLSQPHDAGRWPTNVVLSHPPLLDGDGRVVGDACADGCVEGCPVAELDAQSGTLTSGLYQPHHARNAPRLGHGGVYGNDAGQQREAVTYGDSGGASRFFPTFRYQAKADDWERPRVNGVAHPTVKPLDLMRWLVRLVTPPGGTVLDQFAGSGTTVEAALMEDFRAVGIEQDPDYLPLIRARVERARIQKMPGIARLGRVKPKPQPDGQTGLFDDLELEETTR